MGLKIKRITHEEAKIHKCKICKRKFASTFGRTCTNCYDPIATKFNSIKQSAKKREIPFELTRQEFKKWWSNTPHVCLYCGITPEEYVIIRNKILSYTGDNPLIRNLRYSTLVGRKRFPVTNLTVDRINGCKGYLFNNICKACLICNIIKGMFLTPTDLKQIKIIEQIKKILDIA